MFKRVPLGPTVQGLAFLALDPAPPPPPPVQGPPTSCPPVQLASGRLASYWNAFFFALVDSSSVKKTVYTLI